MDIIKALTFIGQLAIPVFILLLVIMGLFKKVDVFSAFLTGAKDGLQTVLAILPVLIGLLAAIGVFRGSGALDALSKFMAPVCNLIKFPVEVLPLVLIRPISGGGALAYLAGILQVYDPDSYIGILSCVLMGSTETIFYTVSVYLGSVGIKNTRNVIPLVLLVDFFAIIIANTICGLII